VSDKPAYVRSKPLLTSSQITGIDNNYRLKAQSLQAVEEIIQDLFDRIDAAGQLNNTYFVFISDNGWLHGQHRLRTKNFPYEETVRMPLYVRGPGITAGRRITALVTIADLAPTFAAWAGASVPADLDGRSLAGLLTGGSSPNRKVVAMKSPSHSQNWRAVRTATHTYVRYLATGEQELYDNVTDPLQLQNLAKQSSSKALLDALEKRSAALATCKAQGCHSLEDAALQ
jgi:arylsulfatase A-like enzyme